LGPVIVGVTSDMVGIHFAFLIAASLCSSVAVSGKLLSNLQRNNNR
jgi:hypothetical protein